MAVDIRRAGIVEYLDHTVDLVITRGYRDYTLATADRFSV
jgi:hypothetical protein